MPLLHMHIDLSEVGQVSNAKPVGKGKDCKYCFRLSNSEERTWPDFTFSSVYTLCYVHLFCNFMLKTKPASCFALFRRYLLFSSFHYVRSDSQSLCSVRTPRALLRGTHHHGRRHSRELTQSIPWGRMVEQVASQAPCRPIKEISQISLFTEFCQMKGKRWLWNVKIIVGSMSDQILRLITQSHALPGANRTTLPRLPRAWSDWSWLVMLGPIEWFCWSEPFRQEDIHTWISKSFRL